MRTNRLRRLDMNETTVITDAKRSGIRASQGESMDSGSLAPAGAVRNDARVIVRKAAVLGAGVMGAQIAAHLANANVKPILFELAAEGKDKNANVKKALDALAKQNPAPGATASALKQIVAATYDQHLALLPDCDLVL